MPTTETRAAFDQLKLVGGNPALDFANTVAWDGGQPLSERLTSYDDLLAWSRVVGLLRPEEAAALRAEAERRPEEARAALERAVALRNAIHRIGSALASGGEPAAEDIDFLNMLLAETLTHSRLVRSGAGYAWSWEEAPALERPLWPLVRAMADLLAVPSFDRLRECQGERCGWLFIDSSKSGRRRWCTMEDCGNRAKARRYYQRHKPAG